MLSFRFAVPWAAAIILVAQVHNARSEPFVVGLGPGDADMQSVTPADLLEPLNAWLDANVEYPRRETAPSVQLIDEPEAHALRQSEGRMQGRMRGLYDPDTATIYLTRPWAAHDPSDVSVLLHELVHHRQTGGRYFYCPGAQEPEAYELQERWLSERGLDLRFNRIAVVLEGGCSRTDIHPD